MTPQEQERKLSQNIIDSLCHISERPDGWLPHIVFVEEEGEDGYPCYVRYNLIDYHADVLVRSSARIRMFRKQTASFVKST